MWDVSTPFRMPKHDRTAVLGTAVCALKIPRTVGNCPNDKHVSTIARESTQRLRGWCYFINGMLAGTEMFWRRYERLDRRGGSAVWNRDFYLLVQTTSNRLL